MKFCLFFLKRECLPHMALSYIFGKREMLYESIDVLFGCGKCLKTCFILGNSWWVVMQLDVLHWSPPTLEVDSQCKKQRNSTEIYVGKACESTVFLQFFLSEVGNFPSDSVGKSHSTRSCPLLGITSLCTEQSVLISREQTSEVRFCRKTHKKFTKGGYFYF